MGRQLLTAKVQRCGRCSALIASLLAATILLEVPSPPHLGLSQQCRQVHVDVRKLTLIKRNNSSSINSSLCTQDIVVYRDDVHSNMVRVMGRLWVKVRVRSGTNIDHVSY